MRSLCLGSILLLALVGPGCRGDDDDDDVTDGGGGGDGGGGDDDTIYQVQDPATGLGIGTSVLLAGVVVTAVDTFGDRSGGFYVQEPEGGPYSGVYVFNQDLALADTLAPGDIVTVQGVIDEFALSSDTSGRTLTEIVPPNDGALSVTKTGTGNVPAPEQVDPRTLVDDDEAEKWEGVLIQLGTVAVASEPQGVSSTDATLQEMTVTGPFRVGSSLTAFAGIEVDDCYASITGIGEYFFNYKLLPRSAADFGASSTDCVYETDVAMCGNGNDDDFDGFSDCADFSCQETVPECTVDATITEIQMGVVPPDTRVRVTGAIVTMAGDDNAFIQEPGAGGPYKGVAIFNGDGLPMDLAIGDEVTVVGNAIEFTSSGATEGNTEISRAEVTVTGAGAVPVPVIQDFADLVDPATAEAYEGVLVQVNLVTVLSAPDMFGEWVVGLSTTPAAMGLHIDDLYYPVEPPPAPGACFTAITGPLNYSFENFKIEPRNQTDVVAGAGCM